MKIYFENGETLLYINSLSLEILIMEHLLKDHSNILSFYLLLLFSPKDVRYKVP